MPPEGSEYVSEDVFDVIQEDLIEINTRNLPVCLIGDFNARTASVPDFEEDDHAVLGGIQVDGALGDDSEK